MNFPWQFSWITKSLSSLWVQIFDFFSLIISQNIFQFKISQQKFCFMVKMVTINRLLCEVTLKTKWIIRMNQDNQISSLSCILKFVKKKGHEKIGTAILLLPQNVVNYTFKSLFNNVCIGHRKPWESRSLRISFSRPGKSRNLIILLVLKSHRKISFCLVD